MQFTSVFKKNIKAYNSGETLIINQGGSRSSKSYSILQLLFLIAVKSETRLIISVVSRALPHLKLGVIRDFDNILLDYGIIPDLIKNKTDLYYNVGKSVIEFFGIDQLDKVHGPGRDILFINEANFIKFDIYTHLTIRTAGAVFIDYNPSQRFWIHDDVMPMEKHIFIHSTYLDNDQIPKIIFDKLDAKREIYEDAKNKGILNGALENWWRIYGEGEIGVLEGAIFDNWRYEFKGEVDMKYKELPYGFGMDYGFHPDPDAMVKVAVDTRRNKIYLKECIYQTNNGTEDLRAQIKGHVKGSELIVAESATPRISHDLSTSFNIQRVRKTKTVADWLRILQDYEIIITEGSYNLERELSNYKWSDKRAGIPIDEWNHLCDSFRYYTMHVLQPGPGMRKR
jgi:phage terminase large subunit